MKLWSTREWKERRREFLKGKKCERCESTENLIVHHRVRPMSIDAIRRILSEENPQASQEEIERLAKEKHERDWEDYRNFKYAGAVCKSCHFAIHHEFARFGVLRSRTRVYPSGHRWRR